MNRFKLRDIGLFYGPPTNGIVEGSHSTLGATKFLEPQMPYIHTYLAPHTTQSRAVCALQKYTFGAWSFVSPTG